MYVIKWGAVGVWDRKFVLGQWCTTQGRGVTNWIFFFFFFFFYPLSFNLRKDRDVHQHSLHVCCWDMNGQI